MPRTPKKSSCCLSFVLWSAPWVSSTSMNKKIWSSFGFLQTMILPSIIFGWKTIFHQNWGKNIYFKKIFSWVNKLKKFKEFFVYLPFSRLYRFLNFFLLFSMPKKLEKKNIFIIRLYISSFFICIFQSLDWI